MEYYQSELFCAVLYTTVVHSHEQLNICYKRAIAGLRCRV